MLDNRGDRDYSVDAGLLNNGNVSEHEGGRGEFLLIQSYDMFVSTLTQAVVRARTFASGEKMSVFAVATILRQHPKKKDPTGLPWRFRSKRRTILKAQRMCMFIFLNIFLFLNIFEVYR